MPKLSLKRVLPPQPSTQRNFTTHLSFDASTNSLAYPCGKSAFVRGLDVGSPVIQFTGHGNANVTVVKFSPIAGSQYVVSGDDQGKVIVWGWSTGEDGAVETTVKSEFHVLAGPITDVSWDFEGKRLCVVGEGKDKFGAFISWDSGNSLGEVTGHSQRINACHFKQSRPMRCITVGDDGAVVFYQGPPFKFVASDRSHHDQGKFVRDVQFSPGDGQYAVSVGSDRRIACFDGKTGDFIKFVEDPEETVQGGLFALSWLSPQTFATASADATVRVWDVTTGKCLGKWVVQGSTLDAQQVGIVALAEDKIASLSLNGTVRLFQLGQTTPTQVLLGHNKGITALNATPLVSGSYDGKVMDWDSTKLYSQHENLIVSLDCKAYPKVASVSWDDTLGVNGEKVYQFTSQPKVACSYGGNTAVVTSDDTLLVINSASKGEIIHQIKLDEPASSVGLSETLLSVGFENTNTISVLQLHDPTVSYQLKTPLQSTPSCISISPSEKLLAAGDTMGKIVLYDLSTKEVKTSRWSFHTGRIKSIAWRPTEGDDEEDLVASASLDTNIIIYSVQRPMRTIKRLNAHKDGANCVSWSDSNTVVSAGSDACIKEWTLQLD
ncbi:Aip1p KNAG_0E02460 [Huiozyma naganishii CBS 8797]|uniref:Anaphase-promoting complex subunit 4-like WD40 domain-containing protein n=1 Tax=Huiozyma naganishii (strain ATCC MYA-139 / BCRC 22969 / CBS 8797 / KCTC 17520 / NBRC 10181 / NCYC 3082 / Yp74L-3) TaxID=1071383 RepID=J7S7V0_HUIN7|nr:hypothetical protein KNAG_0E02460 [Kazachstania naganishii CBS 8797]CCK70506.1 hypothetical protein KNAG_0E02460 [Kazachstania naganishii CBS 8797]